MIPEFLPDGPALVIENDMRVLVCADTHFGAESFLARHGLHIQSQSDQRLKRLVNCIRDAHADLLILLGDVKHSIPVTTWQENREMPKIFEEIRKIIPFKVMPGNHDVGIEKFLEEGELLPKEGAVIDGTAYIHGHTYPSPDILGNLIVCGHAHPVACLYDEVGCSLRSQPAYLLSGIKGDILVEKSGWSEKTVAECREKLDKTRVLFVPAFFELAGGLDVREISKSGLGPLFKCVDPDSAEVFLSDGTYINRLSCILDDHESFR